MCQGFDSELGRIAPQAEQAIQARLLTLKHYAALDGRAAGLLVPEVESRESLEDFMSCCGDVLFGQGDPVLDNIKRNLAIQVFLSFSTKQMFDFGSSWLQKWERNAQEAWWLEWVRIVERRDAAELVDILLAFDQQRVRQRLSMPLVGMLDFDAVLRTKRRFRHEKA